MEGTIIIISAIFMVIFLMMLLTFRQAMREIHQFKEWIRHNNPGGEIDIIMGNGDRYKIKMDKKK